MESIDLDKALIRVRGKQDLLLRLLTNFKKQKADIAERITAAMQQNDLNSAKALVHSLKGEAGTLEATTLFVAAKNLEQQLLQPTSEQQQNSLVEVTLALQEVLKDINQLEFLQETLQSKAQQSTSGILATDSSLDIPSLAPQLQDLAKLLQDNNLRAKKLAKNISSNLSTSKYSARWENLLQALSDLDFDLAQEHLQALAADLNITI